MKKFVSKVLAGALGLSMLCGVAAAEGETYVSWYTFGDVYLSSVRTALDAAMEAKGLTVVDKDSNANQQTQTDDINTALVTGALTLLGVIISNNRRQAVTDTKVEELAREVREHNNFARRVPVVEEQIKVINHRIEDLEGFHKPA